MWMDQSTYFYSSSTIGRLLRDEKKTKIANFSLSFIIDSCPFLHFTFQIWSMGSDQPVHSLELGFRCFSLDWRPNAKKDRDERIDDARKAKENLTIAWYSLFFRLNETQMNVTLHHFGGGGEGDLNLPHSKGREGKMMNLISVIQYSVVRTIFLLIQSFFP